MASLAKVRFWGGWVLSALVIFGLTMSTVMKLIRADEVVKQLGETFGYPEHVLLGIGITEFICVVLYAIPRTSVLGAILLTGYLGGAIATHVRVSDAFIGPVVFGVFAWLGLYLRDERIRALIPLRSSHSAQVGKSAS